MKRSQSKRIAVRNYSHTENIYKWKTCPGIEKCKLFVFISYMMCDIESIEEYLLIGLRQMEWGDL